MNFIDFHHATLARLDPAADAAEQRNAYVQQKAIDACTAGSSSDVTLTPDDLGDIDWYANTASLWVRLTVQLPENS